MQFCGSAVFSEPIYQSDRHSPKYIKTGSLTNLSSNQAQKAINYIKGERQMLSPWVSVASKERSPVRVTVTLTLPGWI